MTSEPALDRGSTAPDITLVVCTYNRSGDLRELLGTALTQDTPGGFRHEVLVVDNNSSDDTQRCVEALQAAGHGNLYYVLEPRQGKSYALTNALGRIRSPLYTITDDDFLLPSQWLGEIVAAFRDNPDAAFVSGKVLPSWRGNPEPWLTSRHWSAIAMADHGEQRFYVDTANPICLLACAFRLADVLEAGGYPGDLAVSKGRVGGTEDADLLMRLWRNGKRGLYLPGTVLYHKVEPKRLTKAYHRRWHRGHGRSHAMMRVPELERARARLFDVPSHLFGSAGRDLASWAKALIRRDEADAFWYETRLQFFWGFVRHRAAEYRSTMRHGVLREVVRFLAALAKRNR